MSRKWLKAACAALTAAALTMSMGSAAIFAAESDVSEMIPDLDIASELPVGAMTSEFKITGTLPSSPLGDLEIDADVTAVVDPAAGAQCMSGTIGASGMTFEFQEYFDTDKIMVKIPGMQNVLSYDYKADPAGTALGEIAGVENLTTINKVLQLMSALAANDESVAAFGEEIMGVVQGALSKVEFGAADEKVCIVGNSTETCQGMKATITKDIVSEILHGVMGCTLPNGQTYGEYFAMIASLEGQTVSADEFVDSLDSQLADMPDMDLAVYMDENGSPVEVDLIADGSTLALQFRGEAIPYTDIYLVADDEVVGSLKANITETGAEISVTAGDGDQAMNIGTLTFDAQAGTFAISSPYLPQDITGTFSFDGTALSCSVDVMGLHIEGNFTQGGTVAEPEGEVVELTQMSEEELSAFAGSIQQTFGGAMDSAA